MIGGKLLAFAKAAQKPKKAAAAAAAETQEIATEQALDRGHWEKK